MPRLPRAPIHLPHQLAVLRAYAAFTYPFACVPFLYFYFDDHGIGIASYATLIAIYYLAMVVAEVPTGVIADRFGQRVCLVAGPTLLAAGFLTIGIGDSFGHFAAGEILLGLGHSLLSGAPASLLFASLASAGRTHEYLRQEAWLHALRTLCSGLAFLVGGAVASAWGFRATIPLTAGLCAIGAAIAFFLRDVPTGRARTLPLLGDALAQFKRPDVRWITGYYVLVFCLLRYCFHTYQPYLQAAEKMDPWILGLLFGALNMVAAPWSRAVPGLLRHVGERRLLWALPLLLAASLLAMAGSIGWLGIALFFVHQAPFGAHWAVLQAYANHRIGSVSRTTVLSAMSFAGRLAFCVLFPGLGLLQARVGLEATYVLAGATGVVVTLAVMARAPRDGA